MKFVGNINLEDCLAIVLVYKRLKIKVSVNNYINVNLQEYKK